MPKRQKSTERILIIGGSGYLGRALYREFQSFYQVYGTFCHANEFWENHGAFVKYNSHQDELNPILHEIQPTHVIFNLWSDHKPGLTAMDELVQYAYAYNIKVTLLSHVMVFDAAEQYPALPSYRTQSLSNTGRYFIELEKLLQKLPDEQWLIARTAMIIGINSPVVKDIKMKLIENEPIEVFPNLTVSATTRDMVISQIHYLVNQKSNGIVHCASVDLIHHIDLIVEICERLGHNAPRLTHVYNSNKETYLALMSPENFWPEHLNIDIQEVINQGTLSTIESTSSLLNS